MFYLPDWGHVRILTSTKIECDTPPMYRSMEPTNVDPPSTGFRLRGPAPPAGLLPFFTYSRPMPDAPAAAPGPVDEAAEVDPVDPVDQTEPAKGAAFFDLDRTLLAGASGPAFSAALKAGGM